MPPRLSASAVIGGARRHAADIIPRAAELLRDARVPPGELAGIVVADGPGSFTGLRIGWAAAKGLAHEHDVPVRAIPALLAAAAGGASLQGGPGPVVACFDALRGQVFAAMYGFNGAAVETIVAPAVMTVVELVASAPRRPATVVGDGAMRHADEVRAWCGSPPLPLEALPPGAGTLLDLVTRAGVARIVDATAEPVYGRPAEAQARWEARHGRALPTPPGHRR